MRALKTLGVLAATTATTAAILTACATTRGGGMATNSYTAELDQIRASCEARGGSLIPSGRITGRPALDNPCRIHNATAIPPR